jgi:hypothetical protein
MKHTPGPWRNQNNVIVFGKDLNDPIAKICVSIYSKENARLIAAAPELLEACKAIINVLGDSKFWEADAVLIARAAIIKAEGKS